MKFNEKELNKNEVWVGNTGNTGVPKKLHSLKTARLGIQAYCIDGKKLDTKYYRPLIISKSEMLAYEKIMMKLD